jgi:hypothetical protein
LFGAILFKILNAFNDFLVGSVVEEICFDHVQLVD